MHQKTCARKHTRIAWYAFNEQPTNDKCPLCDVLADLKAVSAKLEKAEREIAIDNDLLVKHGVL